MNVIYLLDVKVGTHTDRLHMRSSSQHNEEKSKSEMVLKAVVCHTVFGLLRNRCAESPLNLR